jgi:hypothetical protein
MTTGRSRLGGVERGISGPQSSADTPLICRVTQAGASIFSVVRFPLNPVLTRPASFGATSPLGGLTRRRL